MLLLTVAELTNPGSRPVNEDSIGHGVHDGQWLFVVADGLGGHGHGEVASGLAVAQSLQVLEEGHEGDLLPLAFANSQTAILEAQRNAGAKSDFKTTLVCLSIRENKAQWAHVGDSRLYAFQKDKLQARTLDHSVPQMLVASGEIKEKDIRFHEDRNRLIRVMGMEEKVPRFTLSEPMVLTATTSFLLCTDGFWELIDEKDMAKCLKKADTPQQWLASMEAKVTQAGKHIHMDNYSAIAVFIR